MKLYTSSSRGYQETFGMDQDTVTKLLVDLGATSIQFIDETTYKNAIAALEAAQGK